MGRSTISREARAGLLPRERVWAAIRSIGVGKVFTTDDVDLRTTPPVRRETLDCYVKSLANAGILKRGELGSRKACAKFASPGFTLVKDTGIAAPRVSRDGQLLPAPLNEAMWTAMRVLKTFTYVDVALHASTDAHPVSVVAAKSYVVVLARAGFFRELRAAKPGTPALHRLARDTGPKAPAITRAKVVFDRNTGEIVVAQSAQEVCDGCE
jgi:hypothetical protein